MGLYSIAMHPIELLRYHMFGASKRYFLSLQVEGSEAYFTYCWDPVH